MEERKEGRKEERKEGSVWSKEERRELRRKKKG